MNYRDRLLYTRLNATQWVSLQWVIVETQEEKFHLCLWEKEGNQGWGRKRLGSGHANNQYECHHQSPSRRVGPEAGCLGVGQAPSGTDQTSKKS